MTKTAKFYTVMSAVIAVLLINAFSWTALHWSNQEDAYVSAYETLTYAQCGDRFLALQKEMQSTPRTPTEYYATLGRAYGLIGSARKAMRNGADETSRYVIDSLGVRYMDIVRTIPDLVQQWITPYSNHGMSFQNDPDGLAQAIKVFDASGNNPARRPPVNVPMGNLALWWFLFQVAPMPFVFVHYAIQIRRRGMSVRLEVLGNPMFPIWLLLWEVGLFRYPVEISPLAQFRRAQKWAVLVLGSSLSCFAGTGKICEKREVAPQHQKYGGKLVNWSFATTTVSNYAGFNGANFFPGVDQQSSVKAQLPCGFYLSAFDAEPLSDRGLRPNFGRELDATAGWGGNVHGVTVDANATYQNVFPVTTAPRGDMVQLSERVSKTFALGTATTITPHLWFREAMPVRGPTPKGGWFVHTGTSISRKLGESTSGSFTAEIVRDSGAYGFDQGWLVRTLGNLTWKTGKRTSVQFPIVTFSDMVTHVSDGRKPLLTFGIGFSFSQ